MWSAIPGRLTQVDVNSENVAWGVNRGDYIWLKAGPQGSWKNTDGRLKHVSVGDAGVWGVNSDDYIYYREGVSANNPEGTHWKLLEGTTIIILF